MLCIGQASENSSRWGMSVRNIELMTIQEEMGYKDNLKYVKTYLMHAKRLGWRYFAQ